MAIKSLKWCAPCYIPIDGCGEIAICLSSDWEVRTVDGTGVIYGKVTGPKQVGSCGCTNCTCTGGSCGCSYEYCIVYSNEQFEINPDTDLPWVLTESAIVALGPSACIISRLFEHAGGGGAGGAFNLTADSGTNQVVNAGNTLDIAGGVSISTVVGATDTVTVNLDLSTDADNYAELGSDGNLFVPTPPAIPGETLLVANDSATINFSVSGTSDHTLTGSVILSGAGDNQLGIDAEGLYVPPTSVTCAEVIPFFSSRANEGNSCIQELVLCEGTGQETVIFSIDFSSFVDSIQEIPAACGRSIQFSKCNGESFNLPISDKMFITQAAHGFGSSGTLVPLKYSATPGEFEVADYSADSEVASFVGQVIDGDSFWLIAQGFHVVSGHGYSTWVLHAGSAPGVFVEADTLTNNDYIQNAFTPITADCIYVSMEEAQAPCPLECCNLIEQVGHGFEVGDIVTVAAGTWTLGVAADSPLFIISQVLDADHFYIALVGCINGLAGISADTVYAVSLSTPGALVDVSTLDPETEIVHCVGAAPADECLIVNMSPCSRYQPPGA